MKSRWITGATAVVALGWSHGAAAQGIGLSASGTADSEGASGDTSADEFGADVPEEEAPAAEPTTPPAPEPPPPPPPAASTPQEEESMDQGGTDHERMSGAIAVGYMGLSTMSIGVYPDTIGGGPGESVTAPIIGARVWLNQGTGVDIGLGFSYADGTQGPQGEADVEIPSPFAAMVHLGMPLVIADSQHMAFEVIPELNLGYARNTLPEQGAGEIALTGIHFDAGVRAGGELHFGFMDVPQLSLQAGVGVGLNYDKVSAEDDDGEGANTSFRLATFEGDRPWEIFTASIAALYYIDSR